jgi:preprotein translocase subunit SecG
MFTFLLIVHTIIAAALVGVILMQRSEGGGLGVGGSPSGLMSARGAADFLTRATTVLATLFIVMSIGLAALATLQRGPRTIDTSLARETNPIPAAPTSPVPIADPLAIPATGTAAAPPATPPAAPPATPPAAAPAAAPAPAKPAPRRDDKATPAPAMQAPVLTLPPKRAPSNETSVPLAQ